MRCLEFILQIIGVENSIVDENFENPRKLISNLVSLISNRLDELCIPICVEENNYNYNKLDLGFSDKNITASIQGLYESGIVFNLINSKEESNIQTSALLIIKNNSIPIFIINGLDSRIPNNHNLGVCNNNYLLNTNIDKINELISQLGKRIDEDDYIGTRKVGNLFTNKKLKIKRELMDEKVKILVSDACNRYLYEIQENFLLNEERKAKKLELL